MATVFSWKTPARLVRGPTSGVPGMLGVVESVTTRPGAPRSGPGRKVAADGSLIDDRPAVARSEGERHAIPACGYSYQYRPAAGSEATSRFRQGRPMLAAMETLLDAVAGRIEIRPLNLAGGVQLQLVDYPMDALRELVVKCKEWPREESNLRARIRSPPLFR
jgi:hypothetical protein